MPKYEVEIHYKDIDNIKPDGFIYTTYTIPEGGTEVDVVRRAFDRGNKAGNKIHFVRIRKKTC